MLHYSYLILKLINSEQMRWVVEHYGLVLHRSVLNLAAKNEKNVWDYAQI